MIFNSQKVIDIIKQEKICSFQTLTRRLNLTKKDNEKLTFFLKQLVKEQKIFTTPEYDYYVPIFLGNVTGILSLNAKGFGFVDIDDNNAIFILGKNLKGALNGDEVKVQYFRDVKYPEKLQGIIVELVKRNKTTFVGTITKDKFGLSIIPLDNRIKGPFKLTSDLRLSENDQVKVRILETQSSRFLHCQVVKILGKNDDVAMDILSAIEDANISHEFNYQTMVEARKVPQFVDSKSMQNRRDLRQRLIVTIDGDDTKDFDDAIEVKKLANGNYLLGVHIADVSHYVVENSALDIEAKTRGTSVYLADRVIPMLPEELSNNICSLNPLVDRLTISAEMEINDQGKTVKYEIFPSVINSKYRLTYQDVNQFYQKKDNFSDPNLTTMLNHALELATIIRKYKIKEGYIDFEITESKIILDQNNQPIEIVARERGQSEMLIEDFMVRANETVAFHVSQAKLPFIYRVHDKPDLERLVSLENVVKILGLDIKVPRHAIPIEFARTVEQIKQFRFDDFMKVMMLRTMAKAVYSPQNIGHFGLASQFYTHFTSPIRRYPDLIVHRLLRTYFFKKQVDQAQHFAEILPTISDASSTSEQKSMELERKVDDIKKAQFYSQFLGKSFEGQITTINKYGFFVEFPNKAGGLVHISTLFDNKYHVSENGLVLLSKNRKLTIGDNVKVTVVNVHKNEGKIDLVLSEFYAQYKDNNLMSQFINS